MRFTIVGAGAVGGSLGAFIARAGNELVLVDNVEERVRAINAHGLQLEGVQTFTACLPALVPEELRALLGAVVAHYVGPGRVFFGGAGTIRLGELDGRTTPRLEAVCEALSVYRLTENTDNVVCYLWGKLALGCVYFATALVDVDFLEIVHRADYLPLPTEVGADAVAVANARGVQLESFDNFAPNTLRLGMDPSAVHAVREGERAFWRNVDEVRRAAEST